MKFESISGVPIDTLPPLGLEYWARLSAYINNNPVQERDQFFMAMLKPLGIEKGKPFQPDARQRAILEEAARIGDAMGRVMLNAGHERLADQCISHHELELERAREPDQEADTYSQLDERLHYTYGAIYTAPGLGMRGPAPVDTTFSHSGTRTATTSTAARLTACAYRRTCRRRRSGR